MATTLTPPAGPMTDVSSMLAGISGDIFAGAADIPVPAAEGVDDTPVTEPEPAAEPVTEPTTEEPVVEAATEPVTEPVTEPATTEPTEVLEDGIIKTKDTAGKFKYRLDENRYKTFHSAHVLSREIANVIGETPTLENLTHIHDAAQAHERLWDHVTSGEPAKQAQVLTELISEMRTAQADGETGVDPTIPFAETMYSTLREQAPDAYAQLRFQAAKDLLGEMYESAAAKNNPDLFASANHFVAELVGVGAKPADMTNAQYAQVIREAAERNGVPFHAMQEMQTLLRQEDPNAALARENAELKARLNGPQTNGVAEQFTNWHQGNIQQVREAVAADAVNPALESIKDGWKDFPNDYQQLVVDRLNSQVNKIVNSDKKLLGQVTDLLAKSRRATNPNVRQQIGEEIKNLHVNRAKLAVDQVKAPIFDFAAKTLKGISDQANGRRTAAQQRTVPQGTGTPVRNSVLPPEVGFKNGMFDSATAMKQAMAALRG
jgi:hypothetical protein